MSSTGTIDHKSKMDPPSSVGKNKVAANAKGRDKNNEVKAPSKIENMPAVKTAILKQSSRVDSGNAAVPKPPPPAIKKQSSFKKQSSSNLSSKDKDGSVKLAFPGAKFDKDGYCPKHSNIQLANPMKDDNGKIVYQELRANCPSCQSARHKKKKTTSLGGGKVRTGHRVHGAPSSARSRSRSRPREASADRPSSRGSRSLSRSRASNKPKKEYDTPFDAKGRCHYHRTVQLAAKKQFGGGWKVLHSVCPKCMEDKFEEDGGGEIISDDRSVRSGSSRRSASSYGAGGDAGGQFDKNGCCALHTHIQVAKKKVFGKGWKVVRACPACDGNNVDADDYSVKSGRSTRSNSSRKSTRSTRSSASRSKPGTATKSGRYGALPFDGDGYCCRHPNVQLAKKKALGGFKIVHHECPECAADGDAGSKSSRRKPRRRKSGTGRVFDDSGSETSSLRSGKSGASGKSSGAGSSGGRRKRIRVRNLRTEDEEGNKGRYSGYVDDDHRPHGQGTMKYEDGTAYEGVWNEGGRVHGKTKGGKKE